MIDHQIITPSIAADQPVIHINYPTSANFLNERDTSKERMFCYSRENRIGKTM